MDANNTNWPTFFLIGAVKSGTGTIASLLKDHPGVFMPDVKEPHYFSDIESGYSDKGSYTALFRSASRTQICGDASGGYLFDPVSPQRIRDEIGSNTKLICILRDPSQAIYSLWGQLVKMGLETRPARTAILSSFSRMEWNAAKWAELYAYIVHYSIHIERYYEYFPKEQLRIYFYEDFFKKGPSQCADLYKFLGVSESHVPPERVVNKGYIWKSVALNSFIQIHYKNIYPFVKAITPEKFRNKTKSWLLRWNKKMLPSMDTILQSELRQRLDEDVRRLEKMLDRDLSDIWF